MYRILFWKNCTIVNAVLLSGCLILSNYVELTEVQLRLQSYCSWLLARVKSLLCKLVSFTGVTT